MNLSCLDLFKVGIGPSSSHTVGPMWAANRFVARLREGDLLGRADRVQVDLFGSLALTGLGHATDRAVILGLQGETPDHVDPENAEQLVAHSRAARQLRLGGERVIAFDEPRDLLFHTDEFLPQHPNGLRFTAFREGQPLTARSYFSVGGGFVLDEGEIAGAPTQAAAAERHPRYPFGSAIELLRIGKSEGLSIAAIARANENAFRPEVETDAGLDRIWFTMRDCIRRGCVIGGVLPGGLHIKRRAPELFRHLRGSTASEVARDAPAHGLAPFERPEPDAAELTDPLILLDWVSLFALAVNEENAAGGRVVTAPTNGAAGVIPAVIGYYTMFVPGASIAGVRAFLLTAAAVGMLYKRNASLSAAEVGCQGEVGVACSMAAAGLCTVLGGTNEQVENAAEIGMEHNLGLTCDPIAGLVQVPCIERNTMGAAKAINAARLALRGDGSHHVSLDKVIETMRRTGLDMQSKYKETSLGGLAVNQVEC